MPGPLAQGRPAGLWYFNWSETVHTPVVAGGKVFFLTSEPLLPEEHLIALNEMTGDKVWEAIVAHSSVYEPTPTYVDGLVLTATGTGISAYEAATGMLQWHSDTGSPVISKPLVINGLVIFSTMLDGAQNLHTIETQTGEQRWAVTVPEVPEGVSAQDGRVFVSGYSSNGNSSIVRAVDAATGEELWDADVLGFATTDVVIAHGGVYVGTRDRVLLRLNPETGETENVINFEARSLISVDSIAAGAEALFVVVGDRLVSLNPRTLEIHWETNPGSYIGGSTVVTVDETVVHSQMNVVQALTAADGTEIWSLNGGFFGQELVIVDGLIIVPDGNDLLAMDSMADPAFA